jgi:hypothetical protein
VQGGKTRLLELGNVGEVEIQELGMGGGEGGDGEE